MLKSEAAIFAIFETRMGPCKPPIFRILWHTFVNQNNSVEHMMSIKMNFMEMNLRQDFSD